MQKIRVAFDLDGVLFDFIEAVTNAGGWYSWWDTQTHDNYLEGELDQRWRKLQEKIRQDGTETEFWENVRPLLYQYEVDAVKELLADNRFDVVFITSRPESAHEGTTKSLQKHFGVGKPVVYYTTNKGTIAREIGVRIAFEDKPHFVQQLLDGGVEYVFVPMRRYNKELWKPGTYDERVRPYGSLSYAIESLYGMVPSVPEEEPVVCDTGAKKSEKLCQLGAIHPVALRRVGEVAGFGGKKYGRLNYLKGLDHYLIVDALYRHLLAHLEGEYLDQESGLPHLAHAAWHCLALLAHCELGLGKPIDYGGNQNA